MYKPDKVGRIWLDKDSFLAPFGHFKEDWEYVYNYYSDPEIAKRLFHDGMDFNLALSIAKAQIEQGSAFIGFYKGKRSAYIILEKISSQPSIYILHGGISKNLYGSGLPQLAFDYVKQFVFDEKGADKLEGYVMHPNPFLEGYFKRGGLAKECEIRDRISVNGELFPVKIFGMTALDYKPFKVKEKKPHKKNKRRKKKRKAKKKKRS